MLIFFLSFSLWRVRCYLFGEQRVVRSCGIWKVVWPVQLLIPPHLSRLPVKIVALCFRIFVSSDTMLLFGITKAGEERMVVSLCWRNIGKGGRDMISVKTLRFELERSSMSNSPHYCYTHLLRLCWHVHALRHQWTDRNREERRPAKTEVEINKRFAHHSAHNDIIRQLERSSYPLHRSYLYAFRWSSTVSCLMYCRVEEGKLLSKRHKLATKTNDALHTRSASRSTSNSYSFGGRFAQGSNDFIDVARHLVWYWKYRQDG